MAVVLVWLLAFSKLPMRQLTFSTSDDATAPFSKLPMRQLTSCTYLRRVSDISKLPMRQLTSYDSKLGKIMFSKLPMRQLTVGFYANILMLPKLASVYSYLTKILCACQNP